MGVCVCLKIRQTVHWRVLLHVGLDKAWKNKNQIQSQEDLEGGESFKTCVHRYLFSHFLRDSKDSTYQEYSSQTTKFLWEQCDTELWSSEGPKKQKQEPAEKWKPKTFELTERGILNREPKHFLFPNRNMCTCKSFRRAMEMAICSAPMSSNASRIHSVPTLNKSSFLSELLITALHSAVTVNLTCGVLSFRALCVRGFLICLGQTVLATQEAMYCPWGVYSCYQKIRSCMNSAISKGPPKHGRHRSPAHHTIAPKIRPKRFHIGDT